ncbi:alpha/beta fold hydrolase [Paenibacillus sp. BAC0078]
MVKIFKSEVGRETVLQSYDSLLERWNTEIEEKDIVTPYGTTHCVFAGNAANPPLLLFHGVGDNSAVMWLLNMETLSHHFYCIAVDTLGGPGKSVPNENYTKQTFSQVDWITSIADSLKLGRFHIAGVSNGAYMAYNYATMESERVERVVCMEGGMITAPVKAMVQTLLMMFPEILLPTRSNLLKVVQKLSSPNSRMFEKHPEVADHLVLLMKNHNQQAMFIHKLQRYDKERALRIRDRLYFLLGDYKLDHKQDFIRLLKDGDFRYQVIPDAGHGVNHEQPEAVNREMISFLQGSSNY